MDISKGDSLPPIEAQTCLIEAHALAEAGRLGAAAQQCERALELSPNWAEAYYLYGEVLKRMGLAAEADGAYKLASHPNAVSFDVLAGLEQPGQEPGNLPQIEKQGGRATSDPSARRLLEEAYDARNKGKLGSALRKCEAVLRLDPDNAEAHNLRGVLLEDMGHDEQPTAAYQEAARLDPPLSNTGSPLTDALELTDDGGISEVVAIRTFAFPSQAHIARARLEVEGIPSFVAQDEIISLNWFFLYAVPWVKLCVREQDAERALAILGWDWTDEAEPGLRCPRCGSPNIHYENYNLRLVYASILLLHFPLPFWKGKWSCWQCGATWKAEME